MDFSLCLASQASPYPPMPYFDPSHPLDSHLRNLPHWQQGEVPIFLTWSLIDSLPEAATTKLKARRDHWLASHPKPWTEEVEKEYYVKFANPINEMLDRGYGECILRDPQIAAIVGEALLSNHEKKYRLHSFVIMPNHVHILVTLFDGQSFSKITQSWKGSSARYLNLKRGKSGTVWQQESWDRLIRSKVHFDYVIRYIRENPARLPPHTFLLWQNTEHGL
ncbi:transposase [bacterium]|nr:transposase [bacterium]